MCAAKHDSRFFVPLPCAIAGQGEGQCAGPTCTLAEVFPTKLFISVACTSDRGCPPAGGGTSGTPQQQRLALVNRLPEAIFCLEGGGKGCWDSWTIAQVRGPVAGKLTSNSVEQVRPQLENCAHLLPAQRNVVTETAMRDSVRSDLGSTAARLEGRKRGWEVIMQEPHLKRFT